MRGETDETWQQLASKQRSAAFTRKAIARRRLRGLRTSQLEERLAVQLAEVERLQAQVRLERGA